MTMRFAFNVVSLAALTVALIPVAQAQGVIKIGAVNPYSGAMAQYGDEVTRCFELAAEWVNSKGGVLGRQQELVGAGVMPHDARRRHGAEPLAHVALVEPGGVGDLAAGGGWQPGEGAEQPEVVAEAGHDGDRGIVEDLDEAVCGAFCEPVDTFVGQPGSECAGTVEVRPVRREGCVHRCRDRLYRVDRRRALACRSRPPDRCADRAVPPA